MKIGDSIGFPFRGDRAWKNIGLLGVAHLIPVLGPIVMLGYGVLVEKILVRDIGAWGPAFRFQYFMKYLERGVMPFLVQLVISSVLMVVILPVMWGVMIVFVMLSVQANDHPGLIVVGIAVAFLGFFALGMFLGVVLLPFSLRASLLGDFMGAFDFRWALDFVKRVGWSAVWALFRVQLVAFPLMLAGMVACYVGAFFTMVIVTLMSWHVQVKLYHLYLDRGGTALAFRDEMIEPAFPVVVGPAPPPVQ